MPLRRHMGMNTEDKGLEFPYGDAFKKIHVMRVGEEQRVLLQGRPYMRWEYKDLVAQRVAITQLYNTGLASQEELAEAFGIHVNTVYNYITSFDKDGMVGLLNQQRWPKEAWKITPGTKYKILEAAFHNRNISFEGIAQLLKSQWNEEISAKAIRLVLIKNGFVNQSLTRQHQEL